ncbi:hypothetical protein BKA70DRAFT_1238418 [Coprinopsis sp. MPI-PUGE-AT-0042]|nr:hypothetical protein BKA70DRAFT_1238418 [Coprinopsis sp. MPI-PUGE-AT-0042]
MPPKKRERSSSVEEVPVAPPKLTTYSSSSRRPTKMRKTTTAFQESLAEAISKLPADESSAEIRHIISRLAESVEAGSVSSAHLETNKGLKRVSKSMKGKSSKNVTVPTKAPPLGPHRSATGGSSKSSSSKSSKSARAQSTSSDIGVGSVLMLPHGARELKEGDSGSDCDNDDGIVKVKPLFKFKKQPPTLKNEHIESLRAAGMYVEAPAGQPFKFSKSASYEELEAALAALLPLPFAFLTPSMVFHDDEPKAKFLLCLCQHSKPTIALSGPFPKGSDLPNCWSKLSHTGAMSRRLVIGDGYFYYSKGGDAEVAKKLATVKGKGKARAQEDDDEEDIDMVDMVEEDFDEDDEDDDDDSFPDVPGFTGFVYPQGPIASSSTASSSTSCARQPSTRPAKIEANKKMRALLDTESDSEIQILESLPPLPSTSSNNAPAPAPAPAPGSLLPTLSLPTPTVPTPTPTRPASPVNEVTEDMNQLSNKLSMHLSVDDGYNPWATERDFDFQL